MEQATQASDISLWMDQLDAAEKRPRAALDGDASADVVIIGAGYTGLWTAYYLKQYAPDLDIAILEANIAGYGASGRNGGWVIGELAGEDRLLAHLDAAGRAECLDILRDIPDEVGRVVAREGLDADFRKGGVLYCAARYPEQETRLRQQLAHWRAHGHGEQDFRWLDGAELDRQLKLATRFGGIFSPHVATVQPARLARSLARCVEAKGVRIYEQTPVVAIERQAVRTASGRVAAKWVVPAVEAYSRSLQGVRGHQIAVQSLIIATEPLSQELWDEMGLAEGQAFSEWSRLVSYGQRSRDNRLVFGARGGYRFGGRLRSHFALSAEEVAMRRNMMLELFPMLGDAAITHGWGGNLGVARRFHPQIVADDDRGVYFAGGYGGEGVGATNLAGRTIASLITHRNGKLRQIPWLRNTAEVARWEPEPLRWLGYNGIIRSFDWEDRVLNNPDSPAWQRRLAQGLANRMESLMQ